MADYAIGDVQGCYEPLMRLLTVINFDEQQDKLWFVGDLVNRGPESLQVLRFIKNLPIPAAITLGNHDLYLLSKIFTPLSWSNSDDTIDTILQATDKAELGHWLRKQALLIYDADLNVVMTHAGIAPSWCLIEALDYAKEVESILRGDNFHDFLLNMYGNDAKAWSTKLTGFSRLKTIINYFTRMRYCDAEGNLLLEEKHLKASHGKVFPWFEVPNRQIIPADIVFGHWAALQGHCSVASIHAIDTGCLWGGTLTALRLSDKKRFTVTGLRIPND